MLRSMMVGLDGSEFSLAALDLSVRWAKARDLFLVGLGVVNVSELEDDPVPLGFDYLKEKSESQQRTRAARHVEQILERFSLRCAQESIASKVLEEFGDPVEQIVEEAQRYDLICLGRQTYFHVHDIEKADSTLHQVLQQCPRPVISVPKQPTAPGPVIVAYDGSLQAARTLQAFCQLDLPEAEAIHIVTVMSDFKTAARHANRAEEFVRQHRSAVTSLPVASAHAADVLLEKIQTLKAGLLVMGCYSKSTLTEFIFGSVTHSLLRDAPIPLFLYH